MALPANSTNAKGLSKLDVSKMCIESTTRALDKRIIDHNRSVFTQRARMTDVGRLERFDEYLLLSTSLQQHSGSSVETHSSCGAGGRLLVGSVEEYGQANDLTLHPPDRSAFDQELKKLNAAQIDESDKFPDWAGGAVGLSTALSHGLGLLSRYRLTRARIVENFGMGRLPWADHVLARMQKTTDEGQHDMVPSPLQPACLVLLTDGNCLNLPPDKGGGPLSLRFGNMPLREFYREPFRWDQRIFIVHITEPASPALHKSLRALCEVTGGAYMRTSSATSISAKLLSLISPAQPRRHSIPDPLRLPTMELSTQTERMDDSPGRLYVNGGPVCSFQCLEGTAQNAPSLHRAMLLFAGSSEDTRWIMANAVTPIQLNSCPQVPMWSIPESFFPSKKMDTLPPRPSQPLLHYSRNFAQVGALTFDPYFVMKALHHYEKIQVNIHQLLIDACAESVSPIGNRMLQRDVYVCDWIVGSQDLGRNAQHSNKSGAPRTVPGREHFPVCVRGGGRPSLSGEAADNSLNIGILHVPHNWTRLCDENKAEKRNLPTMTLLPPDVHILLPLLIKVAEAELRVVQKTTEKSALVKKKAITSALVARSVHLDDGWKSEFRSYLFRLPPYYLPSIRRSLKTLLPPSVQSLLSYESHESLPVLCYSKMCQQKINKGEQSARSSIQWLKQMELSMKGRPLHNAMADRPQLSSFGYGQFDPRMTECQFKSYLRSLPPPKVEPKSSDTNSTGGTGIALLPSSCLLPYYESRRGWVFGGTGLATRGLHVEGVSNGGFNYNTSGTEDDQPLLALAGIGASTSNNSSIATMGDFKTRINTTPSSFVDYGHGPASITTGPDGAPNYSVDDDVLPHSLFDQSGFSDSPQARGRARMVSFGSPFHDTRGCKSVPEAFASQCPRRKSDGGSAGPSTPPGSPNYDESPTLEGEGEAVFAINKKRPLPPPQKNDQKKRQSMASQKPKPPAAPVRPPPPPSRRRPTLGPQIQEKQPHKPGHKPPAPPPRRLNSRDGDSHPQPARLHQGAKPAPPNRQLGNDSLLSGNLNTCTEAQLQNPHEKPALDLPESFMCVWSKSQKRWYFFDKNTNKSVWAVEHIKVQK